MPINSKIKSLYDALKADGADVGSEQEFSDWFQAPGEQGYNNRKYVYDTFKADGADVGKNYEEFAGWLGLHAARPQQQPSSGNTGAAASGVVGGVAGGLEPGSYVQAFAQGTQGNGRPDMVESLNKYYEGLQAQNAPAAPAANTKQPEAPAPSTGGSGSTPKMVRQEDLYVDDKGNPALGTSEEDSRDIERSELYYPLMRNDSVALGSTQAYKKGWLAAPKYDKNKKFKEARAAGYKAQGEKFRDLSDEELVQAMREEEKKLDGSTSPEALQASMNVAYIETLMAAREWGLGDVANFNATRHMVDYHQAKGQYNKNGLVDKYEKNMLTGRDDNPLLIRGWELIEEQYLKDEADGNLHKSSYYRNLPFHDPKFAEEFGAYITARIKVTGERWNDAVKDAIDDFEAAAAEGRVGQRHSEEYLGSANREQVDDMLDQVNSALKKRTGELDDKFMNESWFQRMGESSYDPESPNSRYLNDPDASNLIWAGRALQDAKKIIAAFDANRLEDGLTGFFKGAGRGLVDSLGDLSTWDGGISDLLSAQRLDAAVDKFKKGKPLSASEKALLEATSLKLATAEIFKEVGRGYKAGTVTGESLPFMVEMALNPIAKSGDKIASGLAKYANKYLGKYLKKMVSKLGRSSAGRMATRILGSGFAKKAGRVAARVAGDIGAAGGMAATSGLGHSAANAIGYHTGDVQYQQGAGGKTHFSDVTGGDDWVTSTLKGFGSTTIENASEMWGEYFKPITNFLGSVSGKALEKMHLGAITRWLNDVNSTEMARLLGDFRKQTRWDGSIAEYFEEVAGNIANALTVKDMNFALTDKNGKFSLNEEHSVFNAQDNLDTFLGVSLMSGAMSTAKIVGYRTPTYRAKQDVKRYGDMAKRIFGGHGNDWSTIANLIQDNSEEARKQLVVDLMQSGKYSKREKQIALQYAGAVYKSMGMDLGESKQKRSAGDQEASDAYGRGYNMANLENISETSSAYNQLRSQMEQEYGTELMERMDSEPGLVYGWVRAGAVSEEDAKKVLDYLNAKMAYDGAVDRLNDDDSAAKAAAEAHVDDTIHTEDNGGDGQIHPVALKGREGDFFVVSGNVVTDNNGNVDVDASDNEIVVVDSNGKRTMTTAKDIAQVGDAIDPDAAKAQAVASIESVSAQASGTLDTGANQVEGDETLDGTDLDSDEVAAPDGATQQDASSIQAPLPVTEYNQDDLVTVEVDGQRVNGIVTNGLDSNGNVTLYLEEPINGRQNVQLTPEQLNQVAVSYTSRDGVTITRGEGRGERGVETQPTQPGPQAPQQQQAPGAPVQEQAPVSGESGEPLQQPAANGELDVQTGETPQTPNAPVAEAPQQAPAQPSLPVGEDGNADFSAATPQEAHDYIYNDPELDEDEANQVVQNYADSAAEELAKAQAVLDELKSLPAPQMKDYGRDTAGYKRDKKQRNDSIAQAQAAVDAAQRDVDLWNGVQAQHMMDRAAAKANRGEESGERGENPTPAPVSGENENNAPAPSQATLAQGQQTTESTQEPSSTEQPNEGNGPVASTSPATGVDTQPQEENNEGDGEDQAPGDSGESASPEASGVETRELTPDERIERARMESLENRAEELAESCGLPVQVARSLDDLSDRHRREVEKQHAEGKYVNGFYDPMTKQIVLFLPDIAKNGGLRRLERTFLHEGVAHGGLRALFENAQNGIQTFDELCDQVWEMMPAAAQASMMNYIGVQKPEDMTQEKKRIAADEYMAHLAEWGVEPSVKSRIIAAIKNALRKIGVKMKLSNNDIVSLLAASRRHLNEMDKVRDSLEDHGIATSDNGDALMFAVSDILEGDERKKAIKELMDVTGRSEATVKKWLKAEESLAKVILDNDNVELLDLQVDESVPSIWNNSDYPQGTVEFSNICRKRLPFTVIYQRLQEEFPNTVFDASTLEDIRNTMKENGVDVACGLCFVEDRRQLLGEIGEGFIKMVEGEEADINENQQKALDKLRESGDNYVPNLYELLTLDGMKKLRKEHPAVAKAFVEFNNARGMQAGRLFQAYSAYHREILNWNKAKVKKVNDAGGLRIFSFSDFEAHHLIDLVQVLTDCAAKGVKVQGYTKVPEFAKAVKDTKMKLNRSLIAKGKGYVDADYVPKEGEAVSPNVIDGKRLLLDTVEGINVNHPDFFDSTDNNNVGNILVGINDEQIRLAMADSFVDYIIPFHSGLSEAIRAKKGIGDWVNYKLSQLEKKRNDKGKLVNADKHGVNIYTDVLPRGEELIGKPIRNARDFQNAFFKACEEKGWVPRFSKFINKNKKGQYVYTPGYEKLLLDFKLFDKNGKLLPQEAVVPLFDNEFNKKILDDYVKGEKAKTPYDDLYEKIKERLGLPNGTVIKSQEGEGSGVMFSTSAAEISEEEREVLMGIHNITAEKLRSAIGLGGLANPSMAVVDTTKGLLNNFGEISLIPGRDLIDKKTGKNAGTFTADAYTPRFPTVHRRLGKGGEKKLSQWIKSLGMRPEMEYNTQEQFNDWVNGFDIQDNALVYPFLHEKGLSDAVDQEDHNEVSAPFREIVGRYHGDIVAMMDAFDTNEEVRQEITDIIIDDIVKQEAPREDGESWKDFRDRRRKWRQLVNDAYLDFAGFVDRGIARATLEKECGRYSEGSRFNPEASRQAASLYIDKNGMRSEYTQWREQRFAELGVEQQMYAGSDREGRSKYKPITLESVSKAMKKQGLAGGESSFFSQGPGGVRARLTPRLTSLNQIRNERGRIQNDIDEILESYSEELSDTASNMFANDREALAEVLTSSNMKAKAKELGFEISDATVQYLQDFKQRIMELPTEYFETKFERPVMLNEFEAAVVPNDVDSEIREALEAEGLDVREYDPELAGDRERVTMEAAQDSGKVLFSTSDVNEAMPRNTEQEPEVDGVPTYEANNLRFSVLDPERDADLIAELDGQEYVTVYRTMAKVNGEYYPPMDSRDHDNPERLRSPEKLGQYTQSEERPDLAFPEEHIDKKTGEKKTRWKFNLRKSNGKSVDGVAYNPYMHTSDTALNDQFSEAQDRDDLVVVECRVPVSELDPNSYHAEKALDPVGWKPWKAGPIVSKMTGKRNLLLSRWVKPVKELSWSKVADMVSKQLGDQFDVLPSNTFSKGLRAELEKRGYQFIETDNKGIIKEGPYKGVTWSDRYYDIHPELDKRSNKKAKRAKVAEVKGRNAEAVRFSTSAAVDALKDDERVYNDLLGKVFSGVSNETRRGIVETAMRNRGNDFGAATESWLMGLADNGKFAQVPEDDWRTVKNALSSTLRDMGVGGTMTDNEARYVLWKAGQVDDGVFSMAEDIVMRDRLLPGKREEGRGESDLRFSTSAYDVIKAAREAASGEPQGNGYISSTYYHGEIAEGSNAGEKYTIRISDHPAKWDNFVYSEDEDLDGRVLSIVITDDLEHINEWKGRGLDEITDRDGYDVEQYILNADDVDTDMLTAAIENFKTTGRSYGMKDGEMIGIQESGNGIQFSVTPRDRAIARDQYERWMNNWRIQFTEAFQDSMIGLKKLMQAIMGDEYGYIEDIPMYENPYIAENLMSPTTAAEQHVFDHDYMQPIFKEMANLCKGKRREREKAREDLTNYLMAKHGLERNQVLADRDAQETAQAGGNYQDAYAENRERDYSGLTALTGEDDVHAAEAKAQQMVDDYEAQHDTTELWSRIKAATQKTLEKQYKSGMLSYAEYQRISGMFDYYVPLRGWEETTSDEVYGYLTSKAGPFLGSSIGKRAGGRTSKADDPIANIAKLGDDSIRTGNRNLMKQMFLNFVQNHPSDLVSVSDLWLKYDEVTDEWVPVFADIKPKDSADVVEQKIQAFEQQMQELAEQEPDKYKHGREAANIPYRVVPGLEKEHQVLVKRNGQTWVLTINGNPRAAQALNGLTNPDVSTGTWQDKFFGWVDSVNRALSAMMTTYSPNFIVSNFARDTAYVNTMVWAKENKNYALAFHANHLRLNPAKMRRLLGKWENGTLDESKPLEKYFQEFMLNGGETGYAMVQDLDDYKKKINKELGIPNGNYAVTKAVRRVVSAATPEAAKKAGRILADQYELLGRAIENSARFAAFVTSREMGRDVKRSAYDAKEISVNFNKKGSGGKMFLRPGQTFVGNVASLVAALTRAFYTFFNAGVQGMTNVGRNLKRHPYKSSAGIASLLTMGIMQPMLAAMMGAGDGDDDDKNAYYNLPSYVRRSNLCIYLPGWIAEKTKSTTIDKYMQGTWLCIPLPVEYRAIFGFGELMYSAISGNERYPDKWELAKETTAQFSQLLPVDFLEGGGGFSAFIPTVGKPMWEIHNNVGWSGAPIYKKNEWNKDDPEYTKAFSNTSEWLVDFTEWLNAKTLRNPEDEVGFLNWNPAKIEYFVKGYTGGVYSSIMEIMRAAQTAFGDREFEWRNVPLANRILKQSDERMESRNLMNEFYNLKEEYDKTKKDIDKYQKGDNTDYFDYAKKLSFLNYSDRYKRYLIMDEYMDELNGLSKDLKDAKELGLPEEEIAKAERNYMAKLHQMIDEIHKFEDTGNPPSYIPTLKRVDKSRDPKLIYSKHRLAEDIMNDNLLKAAIKRAKKEGNIGLQKALEGVSRSITDVKKELGYEGANVDEIMDSIRQLRDGALRSFGLLDGDEAEPEVEPDVPETEEPQEEWGDEGQDNVSEPEDDEFESFE